MTRISSLWAALMAGLLGSLLLPAAAWAEQSGVADELRRRPSFGGFGLFGALCCLFFVALIVGVVFLVMRSRKR